MPQEIPTYYQEDAATNAALEAADFDYTLGDTSLPPEEQDVVVTVEKRRNLNSSHPMLTWVDFRDEYLDEMLRLEGRGGSFSWSRCASCEAENPLFRCAHQICHGPEMFCAACIVQKHNCLPTHWIEEWDGEYFERRSLYALGLVIQLGHPPGYSCPTSRPAHKDFVVIDVTGIHTIRVNFCECDARVKHRQQLMRVRWWPATVKDPQTCATFAVVRLFQMMNCLGKVSAHDFVRSLELLTNNDGLTPPPVDANYRMTLMMKRAGRGHSPSGVRGTSQAELALRCRACPQDGRNLPDGWNNINWGEMPEDLRYKYFLFLAQDCNFRLINRDVGSAATDPIIGDGLGYFVNHARYTEYLRSHVSEEEISTCSGFQAMFLANRKRVKGLRTTGVGGVTCARHNMWRPNGIGDLQLGERYCNMDFILFSAILNFILFYLILSYDIACQYGKKFWTRMSELPADMRLPSSFPTDRVWFKVPNFHLPPHKPLCHSPFSFHWMWGAGRTHGETVEQNWEFTNGAAASTKMMGLGTRHATLEDLFGFHNWRRLVSWRGIFTRRMRENVTEGQIHRDAFDAFNAAMEEKIPDKVASWKAWVHDWESEQHADGTASPFEVKEKVTTMKEIRLKLAKEELLRSGEGIEVEREDTPSTFISMGLEIEESQRQLSVDAKALTNPTPQQEHDFLKRRTAISKRIRAFRKLQRAYMPHVRKYLTLSQQAQWDSDSEKDAEAIRLFLPSDIADKRMRVKACAEGLPEVESSLREAEAHEALEALRQGLRVRTLTNRFRLRNSTGQRALTRGQGILRHNNVKIHKAKTPLPRELQVLNEEDVRALNERTVTAEERAQRETVHDLRDVEEGGIGDYGVVALGEGRRTLSWIWYAAKAGEPTELELVEALRVEWCKAYARMRRWHEDVVLVEEEMRRTIQYGYWQAGEWLGRSVAREGSIGEELQEGLRAYALEQAHREARTCEELKSKWSYWRERGRLYLERATPASNTLLPPEPREWEADQEDDDGEEGAPDYDEEEEDAELD
ncbi:CxC2 domain-containing protein [Mycena sanguinolenta]|uniref:CxC2 domain-containing protein n=1 Tax=Mycena sanguinolenta TaxID=230812 RepID=A0A8H6WYQ2_9AGAR|nr:CxC2 domain-containing protein [Mycena sanguinolenta]